MANKLFPIGGNSDWELGLRSDHLVIFVYGLMVFIDRSSLNGHISSAHSLLHKRHPGRVLWLCSPAPPRRPEQQREDSQPGGWEKTLVTSCELEMKRSSKRESAPKLNPGELSTAVHPRGYKERKVHQAVLVHSRLVLDSGCKPNVVLGPAGWMDSSFRSSAGDRGLVITPDSCL